jgi:hypothetical protein
MSCSASRHPRVSTFAKVAARIAITGGAVGWSASAGAHITLLNPPSWVVEDSLGNPQKEAPCGGENGSPTGIVSTYRAGSTIEVRWQEGVGHPGHFRIALANDRADLVDPVVVTTNGDGVTGVSLTAEIMDPPTYPVLLDGLFVRDVTRGPQEEPFVVQVELPPVACERCTLQVVQFMANHLPGYFYHHCAELRIVAADSDLPDSALGPSYPDAGFGEEDEDVASTRGSEGGCAVALNSRSSERWWLLLVLGLAATWRRRA